MKRAEENRECHEPLLIENGNTSPQSMIFVPQIRPLALKRLNVKAGLFTPRKCTAFVVIAVLLVLTVARLVWGMRYMYTEFHNISDSDGELVILPEEFSAARGAYCLDGSPPGYYFRKGSQNGVKNWLIELSPGAWCYSTETCYNRTFTVVGSSRVAPKTIPFMGLTSSNPNINPEFHDWNVARFLYCDGASFAGNRSKPIQHKGKTIYMRGFPILNALLDFLLKYTDLKEAKNVLFTGYSAGGLGVFLHGDYVRRQLPASINFKTLSDAGFFLDFPSLKGTNKFRDETISGFDLHNIKDTTSMKACMSKIGGEKWKCFLPPFNNEFLTTPLFLVNSIHDRYSLNHHLEIDCNKYDCRVPEAAKPLNNRFGEEFLKAVRPVIEKRGNGGFLASCIYHCMTMYKNYYSVLKIGDATMNKVIPDWFFERTSLSSHRVVGNSSMACPVL